MDAPKTKRAALTTRPEATHTLNDTPSDQAEQAAEFVALCGKSDSRRMPFQQYRTRPEADSAAQPLRPIGCAATVEARSC